MRTACLRVGTAILAVAIFTPVGAGTENTSSFPRKNPIVIAVQKTRNAIIAVRVPRPGSRDMVGTGVIVDERGYAVTNRHVVGGSRTVQVGLADGSSLNAQVIASEAGGDLAILRIDTSRKLSALTLAPAEDIMVGETVIAIGHPFGYTNTVSTGIVSALDREITMPSGDVLTGLIQTSAPINPGNSGGPLLNINGELIGINVALRDGAQGIAFAINAGTVKILLRKHLSALRVAGVNHGLGFQEKVVAETGNRQKVLVAQSAAPALKKGDEILAVNNQAIANAFDVERALWEKRPGQKVAVKIARQGQELIVQLTLSSPSGAGPLAEANTGQPARPGIVSQSLPAGIRP